MATYEIQGPDGRTYSIDGPEGASREEVIEAIQARMQAQPAAPKAEAPKPAPKPAAPVAGSYGFMGEGIDDSVPVPTPKAKPVASAPEIDPRTGKPYPEAVAAPEPSIWDRMMMWGGDNKAKAANEYAARRTAAERGITINEAYKITRDAKRPTFNPEGRAFGKAAVEAQNTLLASLAGRTSPLAKGYESGEINPITGLPEEVLYDVPVAMANTALSAIRRGDIPVENRTWLDKAITLTTVPPQKTDLNTQAFGNVGQSLGYSATTMVASAIAGSMGTAVAGPVGGITAGFGTSAAVSYGASKDEFLTRLKEKLDKDSLNTFKRPLNEAEWEAAKKEFDSAATKYGAWEAVPEALSNLIFLKVFLAPVKTAKTLDKVIEYTKRAAISQPPEHITETITALGQNKAELEAKLTKEELDLKDAFKQQFVQTLAIGGGMAVGTAAAQQVNNFYETYVEPKVRPGSALAKAIQADLTDYMNQPVRQRTPTVTPASARPTDIQPPEAVDTLNAAPPAPPDYSQKTANPLQQTLAQSYKDQGIPADVAEQQAAQQFDALSAQPAQTIPPAKDTTETAIRTQLQAEGQNDNLAEPPSYVTEPIPDQFSLGLPSEPDGGGAGVSDNALSRGHTLATNLIGSVDAGEKRKRASLEDLGFVPDEEGGGKYTPFHQSIANRLAKAFSFQSFPNLAPIFGVDWQKQARATYLTPEEFEQAAYAKLEDLSFRNERPTYEAAPAAPAETKVEEPVVEKPVEAKVEEVKTEQPKKLNASYTVYNPETGEEGTLTVFRDNKDNPDEVTGVRIRGAGHDARIGTTFSKQGPISDEKVLENFAHIDAITTEKPSVTKTTEAKQTKEEGQAQPAAKPAAPTIEEQEAEAIKKEDEELAKLEATRKRIREIVYGNTASAIDEAKAGAYASLDEAAMAYEDNVYDTLGEEGIKDGPSKQYASKLFKEEIEKAKKPAAKPAAPAVTQDRTESLELLAARNEELEVEEEDRALLNIDEHMKKWYGVTADGKRRKRGTGGGRRKSLSAMTQEEQTEQSNEINQINRDAQVLIKAADKYTPIPENEQDGSQEQREKGRTGAYPTEAEYDYAEAVRLQRLDQFRMALHGLALKSKRRPIKGYSAAADYLRSLKPAERARAKALWEGAIQPTTLPPKPKATLTPAQLMRFRKGEAITKSGRPKKEKVEKKSKKELAAEAIDWTKKEVSWAKPETFISADAPVEENELDEKEYNRYLLGTERYSYEGKKTEIMQLFKRLSDQGHITKDNFERLTQEYVGDLTEEQQEELFLQQLDEIEEVPPSEAQEELEDRTIHDELDDDERKIIANHYGESTYNEVAQDKFVKDVILALNEGLDAVSRVLHDIIKRLQASVLAGIMVMNTSFMTPPMQVAIPITETRTVQVLAEVPKEVEGMSDAGKLAYQNILPAIQNDLQNDDKLFVLTDKPSANVFIFKPDGSLLVQSKVLLGKTVGDYYKGNTDIEANRITTAGMFNIALRDAARGVTERGGDEKKTAGHYDYGKVFVLDKAIDGKYSVTLFHSVWTHEKDAAQRLAALKKAGPEDSRYSFGCINVDKRVYGDLLADHQDQMDGAKMFVVPDNPAATMDFIRGKAVDAGDIVRQRVPEVTKTITDPLLPATPRSEKRKSPAILREEKVAFGRRKREDVENSELTKDELDKLAKGEDNLIDGFLDDTVDPDTVKKMGLSDLMDLTALAAELAATQHSTETDSKFEYLNTLPAALAYIAHTGTPLDAGIAEMLLTQSENRKLVSKVNVTVVEATTKYDKNSPFARWQEILHDAHGLYAVNKQRSRGMVVLAGPSYSITGMNNSVVLHESIHAVTSMKILYVEDMIRAGREEEVDPKLLEAYTDLKGLMDRTADVASKRRDPSVMHLEYSDAFDDVQEFVAYGLTDPTLKALLFTVPGKKRKTTGFSSFVDSLMGLLGVDPKEKTGMKDFVLATSSLMQVKTPTAEQIKEASELTNDINDEVKKMAKRQAKSTAAAERDLKASQSPSAVIGAVGNVQSNARDFGPIGTFLENNLSSMKVGTLRGFLNVAPTSTLFKIGISNGITRLEETKQLIRARGAMRMGIQKEMEAIVDRWSKLNQKQLDLLADTMHLSTDLQEDPSLPVQYSGRIGVRSPELRNMWKQLAAVPDGHKLYKDVRDFYRKAAQTFIANLKQQIATSALSGNINDPTSAKGKAFKEIVDTYEAGIGSGPYFPLMRHGTHWARFGKGSNINFQLRETANDVKRFINAQIKERKRLGDKRKMKELRAAGEADFGYDVNILRDKLAKEGTNLRKIFKALDSAVSGTTLDIDELKKDIFQMHLLLLPEQSFRKMFIPRKNRAGYNRDALRNFVEASRRLSNQLAGSRYNRRISDSLDAAMTSLEGMESKEHYELVVNEIKNRVELVLNPQYETDGWDTAVRFANKFTFMYLLTDVRQAMNNMWSLPSKGIPTLIKYFGEAATLKELANVMFGEGIINQIGVTKVDATGKIISWHAPSMSLSSRVKNSPELTRAAELMEKLEIGGYGTMTTDVYFASPAKSISLPGRILDTTVRLSGALHQGSERIIREALFWSAYNLARKQKLPMPKAVQKAHDIVEEALFRYNPDEMPPWMNKVGPRFFFQFQKYPALTTNYYLVNALEATGAMPSNVRAGAIKAILGAQMMSVLGAGIGGAFGIGLMIYLFGVIDGAWDKYADGRLKKSLKDMSPLRWFKTEFLPEQFGAMKIPGTEKTVADILANGLLDTITEAKISSGISEGALWFKEPPTALDVDAWMNYIGHASDISMVAPFTGVVNSMFVSAVADWNRGDIRKAYEKWMPLKQLRDMMVSDRLREEGLKDKDFDTIINASQFKEGQLFWQSLGYKPQSVAEIEETNYFIATHEKQISSQRNELMETWVQNAKRNDFTGMARANKQINEFNSTYPYPKLVIDGKQLIDALDTKLKNSLGKEKGRQVLNKPEFDWLEKYREDARLKIIENAP